MPTSTSPDALDQADIVTMCPNLLLSMSILRQWIPNPDLGRLESTQEETMATIDKPSAIPPEILAEMQERAERAAKGERDAEDMRRACERMDRMREDLRQEIGETNLAVELIREARDQERRTSSTATWL